MVVRAASHVSLSSEASHGCEASIAPTAVEQLLPCNWTPSLRLPDHPRPPLLVTMAPGGCRCTPREKWVALRAAQWRVSPSWRGSSAVPGAPVAIVVVDVNVPTFAPGCCGTYLPARHEFSSALSATADLCSHVFRLASLHQDVMQCSGDFCLCFYL